MFQIHLWSGIGFGLYLLMISITGSVLVYRNELYDYFTPKPIISKDPAPRLTDEQLKAAATRQYPGYTVSKIIRMINPDQAANLWLERGDDVRKRLFDPRTGVDLGDSVQRGVLAVSALIDLHDNLFAGPKGRRVNGIGAVALLLLAATGLVIWWPGVRTWRRGLFLHRGVGWKRFTWDLHSVIGFWSLAFVIIFGVSGIYLCIPDEVQVLADRIEPITAANENSRFMDGFIYWLAFLHFGRINGIGIPCNGPGVCDQATKAVWAIFGLAPAAMFVTGAMMWWNRVLRPKVKGERPA